MITSQIRLQYNSQVSSFSATLACIFACLFALGSAALAEEADTNVFKLLTEKAASHDAVSFNIETVTRGRQGEKQSESKTTADVFIDGKNNVIVVRREGTVRFRVEAKRFFAWSVGEDGEPSSVNVEFVESETKRRQKMALMLHNEVWIIDATIGGQYLSANFDVISHKEDGDATVFTMQLKKSPEYTYWQRVTKRGSVNATLTLDNETGFPETAKVVQRVGDYEREYAITIKSTRIEIPNDELRIPDALKKAADKKKAASVGK